MSDHDNVEIVRRAYDAFSKGDFDALRGVFADDIVWHVTGAGPLDGEYRGRDAVFGFYGRLAEETGGTFSLEVHDVVANDRHAVAIVTTSGTRGSVSTDDLGAHIIKMSNGKFVEFWAATTNPAQAVSFWS